MRAVFLIVLFLSCLCYGQAWIPDTDNAMCTQSGANENITGSWTFGSAAAGSPILANTQTFYNDIILGYTHGPASCGPTGRSSNPITFEFCNSDVELGTWTWTANRLGPLILTLAIPFTGVGHTWSYGQDGSLTADSYIGDGSALTGILAWESVPGTDHEACTQGQAAHDDVYLYVCTATDTWHRVQWTGGAW